MNYSNSPNHVRVDRFKSSGKWYDTFMLDMAKYYGNNAINPTPIDAVINALFQAGYDTNTRDMYYIVLDPYHANAYPVMIGGQ